MELPASEICITYMNKTVLLTGIVIFLIVTAVHAADTLRLTNGEVLVCSDLKSETNDIYECMTSNYGTVSGNNVTTCDGKTFGIDQVFAKHDNEGYFLKYKTGFVKRVASGRISFFEGTTVTSEPFGGNAANDEIFNPTPKRTRVRFYSIDNAAPHRLRGRFDKALEDALSSYRPSHTMLRKGKRFYITGSIIGGIGAGMLGLAFLNVYPKSIKLPALITSTGIVVAGGSMVLTGELFKKKSIDIFNTSSPK